MVGNKDLLIVPGAHAYRLINGLGLGHFDAQVRSRLEPQAPAGDLAAIMADRGMAVRLLIRL